MKKVGIGIDYSNICKDYNTVYLDRDNTDPATKKCMKSVLAWSREFVCDLLETFRYSVHNFNSSVSANVDDIASKRFLFYSLEKEITLQSYVLQEKYTDYEGLSLWESQAKDSILVQNDADGGAVYFFVNEDSKEQKWIVEKLKDFSLDEVSLEIK